MVWFQCESCGENLKKPKLQNHFRGCASRKLSCIDCGVVFDQQSVQVHTSCVSETEKYGPKDGSNGSSQKPKSSLGTGDVDLSIGLSTNAPWNCSLCKVKATSYETLEGHSQGKKHRAKAKAAQAKINSLLVLERDLLASNLHGIGSESNASAETDGSEPVANGKSLPTFTGEEWVLKKRKAGDEGENNLGENRKRIRRGEELLDASTDECIISSENGGVEKLEVEKSAASLSHIRKAVKWKKLTTRVLLKAPEKGIKVRELFKELLPLVTSEAVIFDKKILEKQLVETLNASSKFDVHGKWVSLAATS